MGRWLIWMPTSQEVSDMGIIWQSLKMAIKSILGNKARSALTMLGIIIGVASVILLTGIGNGATQMISDSISTMGTKLITVSLGRMGSTRSIDIDEITEYVEGNPDLYGNISPYITSSAQVKAGTENYMASLEGTDANYESIKGVELESGRFISEADTEKRAKVCVVGMYVKTQLFGGMNPVGQKIKLNGENFTIIGVYEAAGTTVSERSDGNITIPYTTAMRFIKNKNISTYYIESATEDTVDAAVNDIEYFLTRKMGSDDGFNVSNIAQMLDTMNEMMGTMTAMLGGIAGISLVVGGIGVMNIMTVSVSERTREIGIRKAIGARTGDILLQFLIESVMLSVLGGVIGIILGISFGPVVEAMLGMDYIVKADMMVLAFGFSAFIGVFFGIAPAKKAAKLHPIEALRSE